ncbi:anti-sigma factor family protein [Candidatus Deferrimicrobium sp.]|uniref:anti-sigma factor family protein n=1 Tax=Candidatus Deferrimicrobium sp. TaxID=3060586 RepID=UPI002ED39C77
MDCRAALEKIELKADGLLSRGEAEGLAVHLAGCPACAAEDEAISATGTVLRALTGIRAKEKDPALDAMWTRVRAGIVENRETQRRPSRIARWAWMPAAAALAVLVLLFYPAKTDRSPFHPRTFDVAVEDVDSEDATVALVDKGEDLPRVIWIIEDAKT